MNRVFLPRSLRTALFHCAAIGVALGFGYWFADQQIHILVPSGPIGYPWIQFAFTALEATSFLLICFWALYLALTAYCPTEEAVFARGFAGTFMVVFAAMAVGVPKGIAGSGACWVVVAAFFAATACRFLRRNERWAITREVCVVLVIGAVLYLEGGSVSVRYASDSLATALGAYQQEIPFLAPVYKSMIWAKLFSFSDFTYAFWGAAPHIETSYISYPVDVVAFGLDLPSVNPETFSKVSLAVLFVLLWAGSYGFYLLLRMGLKLSTPIALAGGIAFVFGNQMLHVGWIADGPIFTAAYAVLPFALLLFVEAVRRNSRLLALASGTVLSLQFYLYAPHPEATVYVGLTYGFLCVAMGLFAFLFRAASLSTVIWTLVLAVVGIGLAALAYIGPILDVQFDGNMIVFGHNKEDNVGQWLMLWFDYHTASLLPVAILSVVLITARRLILRSGAPETFGFVFFWFLLTIVFAPSSGHAVAEMIRDSGIGLNLAGPQRLGLFYLFGTLAVIAAGCDAFLAFVTALGARKSLFTTITGTLRPPMPNHIFWGGARHVGWMAAPLLGLPVIIWSLVLLWRTIPFRVYVDTATIDFRYVFTDYLTAIVSGPREIRHAWLFPLGLALLFLAIFCSVRIWEFSRGRHHTLSRRLGSLGAPLVVGGIFLMLADLHSVHNGHFIDNPNGCRFYVTNQSIAANSRGLLGDTATIPFLRRRLSTFEDTLKKDETSATAAQYQDELRHYGAPRAEDLADPVIPDFFRDVARLSDSVAFASPNCVNPLVVGPGIVKRIVRFALDGLYEHIPSPFMRILPAVTVPDVYPKPDFRNDSHVGLGPGLLMDRNTTTVDNKFMMSYPLLHALYLIPNFDFHNRGTYQYPVSWQMSPDLVLPPRQRKMFDIAGVDVFTLYKGVASQFPDTGDLRPIRQDLLPSLDPGLVVVEDPRSYGAAYVASSVKDVDIAQAKRAEPVVRKFFSRKAGLEDLNAALAPLRENLEGLAEKHSILLENTIAHAESAAPSNQSKGQAEIMGMVGPRAAIGVDCNEPRCLLVYNMAALPGWHAYRNGTEQPIARANYAFLATEIPHGHSFVWFIYQPILHVLMTAATLIWLLSLLV